MEIKEEDYLAHYGTPRHSGRYPWGSGGEDTDTRNAHFLDHVEDLKRQGLSEVEIAQGLGMTTTELRKKKSIAKNEQKQAQILMAQRLKDRGNSNVAIGERMGLNESSVRALLAPGEKDKVDVLNATAKSLKNSVDEKKYLDIGKGVEQHVGVSTTKFNNAVSLLQDEGYTVHNLKVEQLGTGHQTNLKVLALPGTPYGEVVRAKNQGLVKQYTDYSENGGKDWIGIKPALAIHPDRVGVTYGPEGGTQADGVIFVRPGVKDISLGAAKYAQVRVQVGPDHYLKGMAMYKDDLPDGTDLLFNTNKPSTGNKLDAFKKIDHENPDNPFGATIRRQITEKHGDEDRVTSAMNVVNEEGDWSHWSKSIATQVLSKQSPMLAKTQLSMTYEQRLAEFNNISKLTNPTVRKKLLDSFANETDAAAVHLKAAALPRQGWHVILPMNSLPETQIYAPNFRDGERVVLVRYPHGGTFEIPELTVNNAHAPSKKALGNARDAVAIHPKVAERLSGADFDGDTVLVIPNNQNKIAHTPALDKLKDFDPRASYPKYDGMHVMTASEKGMEMGKISNLITDMTIRSASHEDIAQAVRHSMVVIDAEKHELDYKQSYIDHGIAKLKEKYQGSARSGAKTIISKAQAEERVPHRQPRRASKGGPIDKETGKRVFEETGKINFITGKPATTKSKKLAEVEDARILSSGTPIERIYADHSNKLKALANTARLALVRTPSLKYSPSAKKVYDSEVKSLNAKLALAQRNAPLERQAQILANSMVRAKRDTNPNMDQTTLKKIRAQALEVARTRTGAKKAQIVVTDKEWEAIQAGAISNSKLTQILDNSDLDVIKKHAQPRTEVLMTSTKTDRAKQMLSSGYSRSEVANLLGVSISTLDKAVYGTTSN